TVDNFNLAWVHDFGHDRHAKVLSGGPEQPQSVLAQALEAVRAGPGLERAAPEDVRPGPAHPVGDLEEQGLALDRTRSGDHREMAAADLDPLHRENRVFGMELPAGQFERLEDRHHLLDARNRLQRLDLEFGLVSDDPDDGPRDALAEVRRQSQRG